MNPGCYVKDGEIYHIAGWSKDIFSNKDYLYKAVLKTEIPDIVSLKKYMPPVRNQGNIGSCVGHGIGANLGARAKQANIYVEPFSPTWIYNGARYIEGTLNQDVGCRPRNALDWLNKQGCLLEHYWPYNPLILDKSSPPSKFNEEAKKHPLIAYHRVVGGVDGVCEALADGQCVSIGNPWFDKWLTVKNGVLPDVTKSDDVIGGHETTIWGCNKNKKVFYGQNSWGLTWGDKGHYTMPFSALDTFKSLGGYDAHVISPIIGDFPKPVERNYWQKFLDWIRSLCHY